MYKTPSITGVMLEVYKENRLLKPEPDGYISDPTNGFGDDLCSGSTSILAIVAPNADKTIGFFRDGKDHYIPQKELLALPELRHGKFPPTPAQQFMRGLLADRFKDGSMAYGIKIPLRICDYNGPPVNTVHYPENMLVLAQYVRGKGGCPTDGVQIWKVALVSQNGEFFLTVQQAYNVTAYHNASGQMCVPRFEKHRLLERVLVANAPADLPLTSDENFVFVKPRSGRGLQDGEGIVDRWYSAKNMGCVITAKGPARVHWSDVPPRPRLRFLNEGERVKIGTLGVPPQNPKTDLRTVRKAQFDLQASGIEIG